MELWNDFAALPYADALMIGVGALLVIVAVVRILASGLALLVWLVLAALGLAAVAHGAGRAPWETPDAARLGELLGPGAELSRDALRRLCPGLDDADGG